MVTYLPLYFLREKISELETALFYNLSSSVFKIPTSVVRVLCTDDCGQIWFCLPSYSGVVNEMDKRFPSFLQFFRKGQNFHVKITGKAYIVNDPEEVNSISWINNDMKVAAICGQKMLIKVKIQYADYFEQKVKEDKIAWNTVFRNVYSAIFHANQPKYTFLHTITANSNSFPGKIQYQ
jgi:general stress protein 26